MTSKSKIKEIKPEVETFAKIKVVGIGGGGNSAVNRMLSEVVKGVEFVAVNTDAQALHHNLAKTKIHIGREITRGLGAGMNPEVGRDAAEESIDDIREALKGANLVFITCGMGGGTGTGAAPIIADIAREVGALTVAVVTKPFIFEGSQRNAIADRGLEQLTQKVDTIITIPNDKVLQIIDKKTSLLEAFFIVDEVLRQGVKGIAELITIPGLINVDFNDVKTIMQDAGSAIMGIGRGSGDNRAIDAANEAISSPLLEMSIDGARGILFTISGSKDLGMSEVNEAARIITSSADPDAKIIFGTVIDETLKEDIKITVIATGFDESSHKSTISSNFDVNVASAPVINQPEEQEEIDFNPPIPPSPNQKPDPIPQKIANEDKSLFKNKQSSKRSEEKKSKEEEELEIPAFIRRKMN
jgi:cell division protein FtsZ